MTEDGRQKTGKASQIHSFNKIENISEHSIDGIMKRKREYKAQFGQNREQSHDTKSSQQN